MKSWVSSAFTDTELINTKAKKETKKNKENIKQSIASTFKTKNTNQVTSNKESLTKKYEPITRSDLVVNKNKIDQLNNLIDEVLNRPKGSILLIEGPSGCGKYSTLKVLCNEKNVDLIEWNQSLFNLKSLELHTNEDLDQFNQYESQIKLFTQFLFKSSRYQSNQIFSSNNLIDNKKILFVKEIPNFAFKDTNIFINLLKDFKNFSKYPLIFSITLTTYSFELNPQRIFSLDIRKSLNINEITFNSFASTYLNKQIERIAKCENFNFVDKNFIESICVTSNGDLRHAINLLELASVEKRTYKDLTNTSTEAKISSKRKVGSKKAIESQKNFDNSSKDANFNIFRGLGKILHRKNLEYELNEDKYDIECKLPKHLSKFIRPPLSNDPEDIYDKLPLNSQLILSYLHQNYIDIFNQKSISADFNQKFVSLNLINESFMLSDMINKKSSLLETSNSGNQDARLKEISASIAIRSILFNFYFKSNLESENASSSKSLWMPLYKPYNSKLIETIQKRKKMARDFLNMQFEKNPNMIKYLIEINKEFFTEFIPFFQLNSQSNKKNSYSVNCRQECSQLFSKYVTKSSKLSQTNENDSENLDGDNLNEFLTEEKKEELSKIQNIKGSYSYEDHNGLNIVDFNF